MSKYFEEILSPVLCGFRKGFSTQHALLRIMKACQESLDNSEFVGMVLMDLSKAYDCIPHDLLIAKLKAYGIQEKVIRQLTSYLSDRKQKVKVNSFYSILLEIYIGIPQGSILGPLLFNIFINNLLFSYDKTCICNFADDNTILSKGTYIKTINTKLQRGLNFILEWYDYNNMKANSDKFKYIIFHRNTEGIKTKLKFGEIELENLEHVKLLGIYLDRKLLFNHHINTIVDKAQKKSFCTIKNQKIFEPDSSHVACKNVCLIKFQIL